MKEEQSIVQEELEWSIRNGVFSICSKCKARSGGICTAEGIGRETSGSSSPRKWGREKVDCIMSECCHRVAEIHL